MNSPFKSSQRSAKLAQPGESLQKAIDDMVDGPISTYALIIAYLFVMPILSWFNWWLKVSMLQQAWIYTVVACLTIPIAIWKLQKHWRILAKLKQGRDGERNVADYLHQHVYSMGYVPFHNLVEQSDGGGEFDIDHILVGSAGVLVLETKNPTLPTNDDAFVGFNGEQIQLPGDAWRADTIRQVKANADRVREILFKRTGKRDWPVRPVVVFPLTWQIERNSSGRDLWVLNPYGLRRFLECEPASLSVDDRKRIAAALAEHQRARVVPN